MSVQRIKLIKLGGTIEFFDPSYDNLVKKLIGLDTSIENYFDRVLQPHFEYTIETIAQKDSRELTDDDREALVSNIMHSDETDILVTHGTFTMEETARFIEKSPVTDKKIIITGSMIPLTGFSTSDAGFNLGFAVGSFNVIDPGVYICMNGGIFSSDEISKNPEKFRFE